MSSVATLLPPASGTPAATGLPGRPHNTKLVGRCALPGVVDRTASSMRTSGARADPGVGTAVRWAVPPPRRSRSGPGRQPTRGRQNDKGRLRGGPPSPLPEIRRIVAQLSSISKVAHAIRDPGSRRLTLVPDRDPQPLGSVDVPRSMGG